MKRAKTNASRSTATRSRPADAGTLVVSASEAAAWYARLFEQGRHGRPPPEGVAKSFLRRGRCWVVASIPLGSLIYHSKKDASSTRIALAKKYAKQGGEFPPGVGSYDPRIQPGKVYIQDGNHRALAAQMRGDRAVHVLMPMVEYRAFVRDRGARRKVPRRSR